MTSGYQELQFQADRLGEGQHRIVCPFCAGGSDRERSLSLIVDKLRAFSFRCYRSSCGTGGGKARSASTTKREPRHFVRPTTQLNQEQHNYFVARFGFVPEGLRYCEEMDRYVYSVRDPQGLPRGHIARSYSGDEPKVLTYDETPHQPFIGWAGAEIDGPVIAVEDWVSAEKLKASNRAASVALNGTYLSLDMVTELQCAAGDRPVVLALDRDAFPKAIKYLSLYGDLFSPRLRVWRLEVDIKNESFERIGKAITNANCDFGSLGAAA